MNFLLNMDAFLGGEKLRPSHLILWKAEYFYNGLKIIQLFC